MNQEPIKSQKEAEQVFEYLVSETIRVAKTDRATAEKRINDLLGSGLLEAGSPDDPFIQKIINEFMLGKLTLKKQ